MCVLVCYPRAFVEEFAPSIPETEARFSSTGFPATRDAAARASESDLKNIFRGDRAVQP